MCTIDGTMRQCLQAWRAVRVLCATSKVAFILVSVLKSMPWSETWLSFGWEKGFNRCFWPQLRARSCEFELSACLKLGFFPEPNNSAGVLKMIQLQLLTSHTRKEKKGIVNVIEFAFKPRASPSALFLSGYLEPRTSSSTCTPTIILLPWTRTFVLRTHLTLHTDNHEAGITKLLCRILVLGIVWLESKTDWTCTVMELSENSASGDKCSYCSGYMCVCVYVSTCFIAYACCACVYMHAYSFTCSLPTLPFT